MQDSTQTLTCGRCEQTWQQAQEDDQPRNCPHCNSPYWRVTREVIQAALAALEKPRTLILEFSHDFDIEDRLGEKWPQDPHDLAQAFNRDAEERWKPGEDMIIWTPQKVREMMRVKKVVLSDVAAEMVLALIRATLRTTPEAIQRIPVTVDDEPFLACTDPEG